jgi:hypothetical protein
VWSRSGGTELEPAGRRSSRPTPHGAERVRHDLFQQFIGDRDEYRLGVLNNQVVSAYRKEAPADTSPEELRPEMAA